MIYNFNKVYIYSAYTEFSILNYSATSYRDYFYIYPICSNIIIFTVVRNLKSS